MTPQRIRISVGSITSYYPRLRFAVSSFFFPLRIGTRPRKRARRAEALLSESSHMMKELVRRYGPLSWTASLFVCARVLATLRRSESQKWARSENIRLGCSFARLGFSLLCFCSRIAPNCAPHSSASNHDHDRLPLPSRGHPIPHRPSTLVSRAAQLIRRFPARPS